MEDGVGGRGPHEGPGIGVVVLGEAQNLLLELGDGREGAAADSLLRDEVEPDLDLVEPGSVGGGEVEMVAGPVGQPAFDAGMLVGGVVVDDEVDIEVRGHVGVNVFQEAQELLVAMTRPALGEDPAGDDIQGREEGGGAVANIAVRDAFDITQPEGQEGLGALQSLDLGWKVALRGGRCRALCSEHAAALPSTTDSARPDPSGLSASPCVGAGGVVQQGQYCPVML